MEDVEGVEISKLWTSYMKGALSAPSLMVGSLFVPQGRKDIEDVRTLLMNSIGFFVCFFLEKVLSRHDLDLFMTNDYT